MPRVAVIADIHAGWPALQSAADAIAAAGIEKVWSLGDWCAGGGAHPAECFDWVTCNCDIILNGNHEMLVVTRVWKQLAGGFAHAAYLAHEQLGPGRCAQLRDHDAHALTQHAELVHGALTNPTGDFISTPAQAERNLKLLNRPLLLYGHTHQAALWTPQGRHGARLIRPRGNVAYELEMTGRPGDGRLLNPGAVSNPDGARWLELSFAGQQLTATWHQERA